MDGVAAACSLRKRMAPGLPQFLVGIQFETNRLDGHTRIMHERCHHSQPNASTGPGRHRLVPRNVGPHPGDGIGASVPGAPLAAAPPPFRWVSHGPRGARGARSVWCLWPAVHAVLLRDCFQNVRERCEPGLGGPGLQQESAAEGQYQRDHRIERTPIRSPGQVDRDNS